MKEILICSIPNDYHVLAVRWGIEQLGGVARVWIPGDMPDLLSVSMSFADGRSQTRVVSKDGDFSCDDVGVVWNRRTARPVPPEDASPHDRPVIARECYDHVRNAVLLMGHGVAAVNDPANQYRANLKAFQIETAAAVGLTVQPTLFSNNFDDIKAFFERHAPVIAKPYQQFLWVTPDGAVSQLTFDMPLPDESLRKSIEDCPLIVQKKIDRAFEVRLVAIGGHLTAAKMVDVSRDGILDSRRAIRVGAMKFSLIEPPKSVADGCLRYLESLDLRMGVFDFIVDRQGEWHFLECNEQGQFLFIEEHVPEAALLDRFCRWLAKLAGADQDHLDSFPILTMGEFENSPRAEEMRLQQMAHKKRAIAPFVEYEDGAFENGGPIEQVG